MEYTIVKCRWIYLLQEYFWYMPVLTSAQNMANYQGQRISVKLKITPDFKLKIIDNNSIKNCTNNLLTSLGPSCKQVL